MAVSTALRPGKSKSRLRRGLVFASRLAGLCAVVFVVLTLVTSYRHDMPVSAAARGLLRQTCLGAIRVGMAVHDPCPARHPRLAPDGDGDIGPEYVRLESLPAAGLSESGAAGVRLADVDIQNERIIRSHYEFGYQPYDEPRIHELRTKYGLAEVVAGAPTEFEGMVRLRGWCRDRFLRADYQPDTLNFDALEVLDRDLHVHEEFTLEKHFDPCKFFPLFYAQALVSVGHHARLVSGDHCWVEAWSNQYRKWVALDPELDHHFIDKAGMPLNSIELLDAYAQGNVSSVRLVRGPLDQRRENPTLVHLGKIAFTAADVLPWFNYNLSIVEMREDWMTNRYFRGHPGCSDNCSLRYKNPYKLMNPQVKYDRCFWPTTENKNDFNWTLNQSEIYVRKGSGETLPLAFRTVTPNFDHYEVVVDGAAAALVENPKFEWRLHDGLNTFAVRSVNQFGVRGIESTVRVTLATAGAGALSPDAACTPGRANAASRHD